MKLDSTGNLLMAKAFNAASVFCNPSSIAFDDDLSIYIGGYYTGIVDFDPSAAVYNLGLPGNISLTTGFLCKLDSLGNLKWANSVGNANHDKVYSVAVDNNNDVYITGTYALGFDADPGAAIDSLPNCLSDLDAFLIKLDSANNLLLARPYCGFSFGREQGNFVYIDDKAFYLGGRFNNNINASIDPSQFSILNHNQTGEEGFLIKYTSPCTTSFSTLTVDATDSLVSPSGNYVWTNSGVYQDSVLKPNGCYEVITVNLSICNTTYGLVNPTSCDSYTSPSGLYTWDSTGVYTDTLTNSVGCDSIITVNLTINGVDTAVTDTNNILTAGPLASYRWFL